IMLTRRMFPGALAGSAAAALARATGRRIPVAVQLFSLRRQCEQDLEATLRWVRQAGFEGVEFAGFYGRTATQLKSLLDENQLRCCGSHTPLPQLTGDSLQRTADFNA